MLQGLTALANDAATRVIVLIAKHPSPNTARRVYEAAAKVGKPVVLNFLGVDIGITDASDIYIAETLEDAAQFAVVLARGERPSKAQKRKRIVLGSSAHKKAARLSAHQKYVRGLFSGGTFCYEAQVLLSRQLGTIWSNAPASPANALTDPWTSREHTLIDLGDEVFTRGRPHPMIDQRLRLERIAQEFNDPETAVILFDVVLGYGANANPASEIADTIAAVRRNSEGGEHDVVFVSSVCGTADDPQNLTQQRATLLKVGVLLAPSNAAAARLTAAVVMAGRKTRGAI